MYKHKIKIGIFSNVMTVLYLSGLVGGGTEPFRGPGNDPLLPHRHQDNRIGKAA